MTTYKYQPLSRDAHEIRVAILQPARFDDDLFVSLATLQLKNRRWILKPGESKVVEVTPPTSTGPSTIPPRELHSVGLQHGRFPNQPWLATQLRPPATYNSERRPLKIRRTAVARSKSDQQVTSRMAAALPSHLRQATDLTLAATPKTSMVSGKEADHHEEIFPSVGVSQSLYQDYEALSYEWGPKQNPGKVYLTGSPSNLNEISITQQLVEALRHLRLTGKPRVIWIDAICVDQGNLSERSRQVALMGETFRFAKRVIIWLGLARDDSDLALTFADRLGLGLKVDWATETMEAPRLDFVSARDSNAISHLLSRGYFERLWVRQEIHLAAEAIVWCGNKVISWDNFSNAVFCVSWNRTSFRPSDPSMAGENWIHRINTAYSLCRNTRTRVWYQNLRKDLRGLKWTDHRDTVFAMLNLLAEEDKDLGVQANYNERTEATFEGVARHMLTQRRSLNFLPSCELSSRRFPNLPTWVPDWSTQLKTIIDPFLVWSACAWISAPTESHESRSITVTGIRKGIVVARFRPTAARDLSALKSMLLSVRTRYFEQREVGPWLSELSRALWFYGLAGDYHEGHPGSNRFFALSQCASALMNIFMDDNPGGISSLNKELLTICCDNLRGRTIVITAEGHIGTAPEDVQTGDVICVLLGCRSPMILRQSRFTKILDPSLKWQVVGPCVVPGLMHGEAIYGKRAMERFDPVCHNVPSYPDIDADKFALRNKITGELRINPADILRDFGIEPTSYQRTPHVLDVPLVELSRKGIVTEKFILH